MENISWTDRVKMNVTNSLGEEEYPTNNKKEEKQTILDTRGVGTASRTSC